MKPVCASLILWFLWRISAAVMLNVWHMDLDPKAYFIITFVLTFACLLHGGSAWSRLTRPGGISTGWLVFVGISAVTSTIELDGFAWSEFTLGTRIISVMCIGLWIGGQVKSASYIWPLVMVGLTMDLMSIAFSDSFTQSVIQSVTMTPTIGHPLLIYTPNGVLYMPLFGLADLAFCMILVGAATQLELRSSRLLVGLWIGCTVGMGALLWTSSPMPLLPFLGIGGAVALGRAVRPTRKDVFQTVVFLVAAATICVLFWAK